MADFLAESWRWVWNLLTGANAEPPILVAPIPSETLNSPRSTPNRPLRPQLVSSPDSPPEHPIQPQSPRKPIKKSKRKRKDGETEEFLAMLVEAVDRDAARQQLEERFASVEWELSDLQKVIDERSCRLNALEASSAVVPALIPCLQQLKADIEENQAEKDVGTNLHYLLKRRLAQSRAQLLELMQQIYASVDAFLLSLDGNGRLPAFYDVSGNLVERVIVPKLLTVRLREAAECSRLLDPTRKQVEDRRRKFTDTAASARMAEPSKHRTRRLQRNSERLKRWHCEASAYRMQCKLQEQREREFLSGIAWPFLVTTGHIAAQRRLSEVSSVEDVVPVRATNKDHVCRKSKIIDGSLPANELSNALRKGRREVAAWRKKLDSHEEKLSERLVEHLYGCPNSTENDLMVEIEQEMGKHPDLAKAAILETLQNWEAWYARARELAKSTETGDLLLSPPWAGSGFDVAPSQASTVRYHLSPRRVYSNRRYIDRWNRCVTRARPSLELGSPSDKRVRRFHPSPPLYAALPSPKLNEAAYGIDSPTVSEGNKRRRLRRLRPAEYTVDGEFVTVERAGERCD